MPIFWLFVLGLVIATFVIVLVETSESSLNRKIHKALTSDVGVVGEVRRISDLQRAVASSITVVQVASGTNLTLIEHDSLVIDSVTVKDQDLVLLPNQLNPTENGIYRYEKADSELVLDSSQPAVGSLIYVHEGSVLRNHTFVVTKSGIVSLAKSLLVNAYNAPTHGVLSYDPTHPAGVALSNAPNAGWNVIRVDENTVKTVEPTESGSIIILLPGAEVIIPECDDGAVFHILADGVCTATFETQINVSGGLFDKLTADLTGRTCVVFFDAGEGLWRLFQNNGFVAA